MAGRDEINSIVAVDFGSVNTRIVLVDLVDGAYRLVARTMTRTTADDPLRDVAVGLFRGLDQLAAQTGRKLLAPTRDRVLMPENPDGSGVDALLATASVGRPLRVVVVGLMPDVSVASAQRVLTGSYVEVMDTLSLADIRTEQQQINAILTQKPDLILIVGGTDAGAEEPILDLVRVVRSAVQIAGSAPMVLYAGNRVVQARVRELLEEYCTLFVAENVRPALLDERLGAAQLELAAVYDAFRVTNRGGFDEVSQISRVGVLPTAQSYTNVVRYLGDRVAENSRRGEAPGVLAVDVGSATTLVAASIRRRPYINIRKDLGLGHSAEGLLKATTPGNIRRWLTWDATDAEIENYAYNKTLRPATVPQSEHELELEYALAREAIRVVIDGARTTWRLGRQGGLPALRPIIGAGAVLASAPHSGQAALILLDAIQPEGVTDLWLDPAGLIAALGAVAYLRPEAVVQMLEAGDLVSIGSAICPAGRVRIGRGGMRVRIKLPDGQEEKRFVTAGTVWTYPLPPGQSAQVDIRLSRGLTLDGKSRLKLTLFGGTAGLIFDLRGRPLPLLRQAEARAKLYPRWLAGTRGTLRQRVDEKEEALDVAEFARAEMITSSEAVPAPPPVQEEAAEAAEAGAAPARKARRGLFGRRGAPQAAEEPAEAAPQAEEPEAPTPDAEAAPTPRQRGLFGRRARAEAESTAEEAPGTPSEVDEMMDALRASQEEKPRRFLRR